MPFSKASFIAAIASSFDCSPQNRGLSCQVPKATGETARPLSPSVTRCIFGFPPGVFRCSAPALPLPKCHKAATGSRALENRQHTAGPSAIQPAAEVVVGGFAGAGTAGLRAIVDILLPSPLPAE